MNNNMAYLDDKQKINGKIVDKYWLDNSNIGVIVQDQYGKRYSVEFEVYSAKPSLSNLYGLLKEPFIGKGDSLDRLINNGNHMGVYVNRSQSPVKSAYRLNYVIDKPDQPAVSLQEKAKKNYKNMGHGSAYNN